MLVEANDVQWAGRQNSRSSGQSTRSARIAKFAINLLTATSFYRIVSFGHRDFQYARHIATATKSGIVARHEDQPKPRAICARVGTDEPPRWTIVQLAVGLNNTR